MINVLSFLLEATALFIAARILKVNLTFITASLVVLLSTLTFYFIPGSLGFLLAVIVNYSTIKYFDRECGFVGIVGLVFVAIAVQKVLIDYVINPLIM